MAITSRLIRTIRKDARYHAPVISRIQGELHSVGDGTVELRCGEVCYQLLVPACDIQRLASQLGEHLEFHTLHYLEGQGQGSSFLPRLIGFCSAEDRSFFELFTTVKGLGNRKALRALQLPFRQVASAIAARDVDVLRSLPEIGKRTAETIVAELDGKIERFVELKPETLPADSPRAQAMADAVAVLMQLGEPRAQARQLIERALQADATLEAPDELVAAAFRMKELA
ncbi:MAG: Holliday junction branch migration protein RuvA [Planctomycetota bacterium]|jgi:Holliday junction DNA helicase RuvA